VINQRLPGQNLNLPSDGAKAEHDAESKAATRRVTREIMVEEYIHAAVDKGRYENDVMAMCVGNTDRAIAPQALKNRRRLQIQSPRSHRHTERVRTSHPRRSRHTVITLTEYLKVFPYKAFCAFINV
jgi:hypothetical protein